MVTPPDARIVEGLTQARDAIEARIVEACLAAGRDRASVTLVAISKTVESARLRAAVAAGLTLFGENRVQEGEAKAPDVPDSRWHLVGPLQSNKARRAIEVFEMIQSLDSVALAQRLDRLVPEVRPGARYPVLLQVNVDADPAKHGFDPNAVAEAMPALTDLEHIEVRGFMTVGRYTDDPAVSRATFRELRDTAARLRDRWPGLGPELSMGMTDDFELAIEEGATIVRVGRAIFGARPRPADPEGRVDVD